MHRNVNCRVLATLLASMSLIGVTTRAVAELVWEFSPTPDGGVALDLHFQGVTAHDLSRSSWIDIDTTNEVMAGGGSGRYSYYFADTLESQILANGVSFEANYVRLGNSAGTEQLFIFLPESVPTGVEVDLRLQATWAVGNLSFSRMLPGVTNEAYPRYGGSTIVVDAGDGALPADANGDGVVGQADYEAWRAAYDVSVTSGFGPDANSDGLVDAADYTTWRDAASSASANVPVPEPASLAPVATALLALASRRPVRCKRSQA